VLTSARARSETSRITKNNPQQSGEAERGVFGAWASKEVSFPPMQTIEPQPKKDKRDEI